MRPMTLAGVSHSASSRGSFGLYGNPARRILWGSICSHAWDSMDNDTDSSHAGHIAAAPHAGNDPFVAHNESTTTPIVVYVTYIVPAGTTALRIDKPNPGCPQN
jgi:hypothetical protein